MKIFNSLISKEDLNVHTPGGNTNYFLKGVFNNFQLYLGERTNLKLLHSNPGFPASMHV